MPHALPARPGPAQGSPCRSVSIAAPANFTWRFAAFLAAKREAAADVEAAVRGHHRRGRGTRRRRPDRVHPKIRPRRPRGRAELRVTPAEIEDAAAACEPPPRSMRSPSRAIASRPIIAASCRETSVSPMRSASNSAGAGPRSPRSASMCRAAPRPIRPRC